MEEQDEKTTFKEHAANVGRTVWNFVSDWRVAAAITAYVAITAYKDGQKRYISETREVTLTRCTPNPVATQSEEA